MDLASSSTHLPHPPAPTTAPTKTARGSHRGLLLADRIADLPGADWDRLMAVNLKGPWLCARAVFPYMKAQGSGKIVNIASGTVFGGTATRPHYVASKAGVIGLTRNLAREVGQYGINVNTLAPGSTMTEDLPDSADRAVRERAASLRTIKRIQTPEDLIGVMVFLCSADSDFMTGQLVNVDGGSVMY